MSEIEMLKQEVETLKKEVAAYHLVAKQLEHQTLLFLEANSSRRGISGAKGDVGLAGRDAIVKIVQDGNTVKILSNVGQAEFLTVPGKDGRTPTVEEIRQLVAVEVKKALTAFFFVTVKPEAISYRDRSSWRSQHFQKGDTMEKVETFETIDQELELVERDLQNHGQNIDELWNVILGATPQSAVTETAFHNYQKDIRQSFEDIQIEIRRALNTFTELAHKVDALKEFQTNVQKELVEKVAVEVAKNLAQEWAGKVLPVRPASREEIKSGTAVVTRLAARHEL